MVVKLTIVSIALYILASAFVRWLGKRNMPHVHQFNYGDLLDIMVDPVCEGCPIRLSELEELNYKLQAPFRHTNRQFTLIKGSKCAN